SDAASSRSRSWYGDAADTDMKASIDACSAVRKRRMLDCISTRNTVLSAAERDSWPGSKTNRRSGLDFLGDYVRLRACLARLWRDTECQQSPGDWSTAAVAAPW